MDIVIESERFNQMLLQDVYFYLRYIIGLAVFFILHIPWSKALSFILSLSFSVRVKRSTDDSPSPWRQLVLRV